MTTRSTSRRYGALAVLLVVATLAACGDGDPPTSSTCDAAEHVGEALRSAPPPGQSTEVTPAEEQAVGARLVFCADLADPFVLNVDRPIGQRSFVFGTQTPDANLPVLITKGIIRQEKVEDALPKLPAWAKDGGSWSPSVLARDDGFVLYYTTTDAASGKQCISIATAKKPEGPYVDISAAPLVCPVDQGGAIDPSPFVAEDGTAYLYWKNDGNCCGVPVHLWAQPLAEDGRSLTGSASQLLGVDQPWEGGVVEAPSMADLDGALFLFYSGNAWNTAAYATGYATCASPTGPCTKPLDHPWLGSSDTAAGPGGAEVFHDAEGNARLVFHAWDAKHVGYANNGYRQVLTAGLQLVNGAPVTTAD
jgi:beta-xylosidase